MSEEALLISSVLLGVVGSGYFIYGLRQQKGVALAAGVGLCAIPFFFTNPWVLFSVTAVLLVAPFFVQY